MNNSLSYIINTNFKSIYNKLIEDIIKNEPNTINILY